MKLNVLNESGEKTKEIEVNLKRAETVSDNTVLQSLYVLSVNKRKYNALTRTRGEVSGGGKKPWRQKGTGRARQGSTRSPIWRGGGVVHGPTGDGRKLLLNKKMAQDAFFKVLADKISSGDILILQRGFIVPLKTKDCLLMISKLGLAGKKITIVTEDVIFKRSSRNIKGVTLSTLQNFGISQLVNTDKFIFSEDDFIMLQKRLGL